MAENQPTVSSSSSSTSKEVAVVEDNIQKPTGVKRKVKVLEEDEYVDRMSKIVERDFFPDLKELRKQNEDEEEEDEDPLNQPDPIEEQNNLSSDQADQNLSLDKFASKFTSEDNASFEQLMEKVQKRNRVRYPWMYQDESPSKEQHEKLLRLPSVEEQAKGSSSSHQLITWPYTNMNAVMYNPKGVPDELQPNVNVKPVIVKENTRFDENPFNAMSTRKAMIEASLNQAATIGGKIGPDGKPIKTPKVCGYPIVPTTPVSVPLSPLMTWGEVEGTPLRLDPLTPYVDRTLEGTPQFRIPETPAREVLAYSLAEKISKKNREKKRQSLESRTPSSRPTSKLDRLAHMSPAAQRLATTKLGLTPSRSSDPKLAASYNTPQLNTPILLTPSVKRTPATSSKK